MVFYFSPKSQKVSLFRLHLFSSLFTLVFCFLVIDMETEDYLRVYPKRRSVRPTSIIPDPDVPTLTAHW